MVYPTAIVIVASAVMIVMMTFVLPTFETMFKDLGAGVAARPDPVRARRSATSSPATR